jgi:hypothetical protein
VNKILENYSVSSFISIKFGIQIHMKAFENPYFNSYDSIPQLEYEFIGE